MKTYKQDSECIKCGNKISTSEYFKRYLPSDEQKIRGDGITMDEYIKRVCNRCGFKWYEDVLNGD